MQSSSQNSPQIKSINLSLKLLNAVSSRPAFSFNKSISSLQELSNRLQIANLNYAYRRSDRQTAKEWLFDRGVNLSNVQDIAREVKKRQNVQKVKRVECNNWEKLEFQGFDSIEQDDFLHSSQERTAHIAIKLSLSTGKKINHLNNLTRELARVAKNQGKESQSARTTRDMKEQDIIQEFIARYKEEENSQSQTAIHKTIEKVLNINKFLWFRIVYYQIEMVEYLGREEISKRNQLLTVSLKQLEKSSKEKHNFSNDFWKSAYLEYRSGSSNFTPSKYVQDNEIFKGLRQIQSNVNKFQDIFVESSTDLNRADDVYERILKLVVLGRYEEDLFDERIVDDTWLMILSIGLKRVQRSEKEQSEQFKRNVKALMAKYKQKHLQGEECLDDVLAAMLSLGAYDRVIKIYQQLNDRNELTPSNRILFIQLFIILASNTELVEEFHPSSRKNGLSKNAQDIVANLVCEIAYYTQEKKHCKFHLYSILVVVLLKITRNLQRFGEDFDDLPDTLAEILKLSPTDLWNSDYFTLSQIALTSNYARRVINRTLISAKPHSNDDYFKLAQMCRIFRANNLIEHIFLRFLIISELERPAGKTHAIQESDQIINDIMEALAPTISNQHVTILRFLMSFSSLRELIDSRNIDELSAKRQQFESYLTDSALIESLIELCSKEGADLLEIYVVYYEQIYAMQKITLLSRSNIAYLRKKQAELGEQLQKKREKYPNLNSLRLGRLMCELSK